MKWPGDASVVVSIVHVLKRSGKLARAAVLEGMPVERISAFLVAGGTDDDPHRMSRNIGLSFNGCFIYGNGFTFDDSDRMGLASRLDEMRRLIEANPANAQRVRPYIGGEDINNHPEHKHSRYVIDFDDMPLRRQQGFSGWLSASERQR